MPEIYTKGCMEKLDKIAEIFFLSLHCHFINIYFICHVIPAKRESNAGSYL